MRCAAFVSAAAGALCTLTAAQSNPQAQTVFPRDHATVEGFSSDLSNHLSAGVSRMQYLYEQADLQIPNGAQITRVGFRQDKDFALVGHQLQLEVWLGKAKFGVKDMTSTFANNYDGAPVVAFAKKVFSLPNFPKPTQEPSPNIVWVTLDQPYVHDGSKNLIVDLLVHANSNANAGFHYALDLANYYAPIESFGAGCQTSSGSLPDLTSTDPVIGELWTLVATSAPASANVMIIAGTRRATSLPLDFIGMDNCNLFVNELGCLAGGVTNTGGSAVISLTIPDRLSMYGQTMAFQLVIDDPFANTAGMVASNGLEAQFGLRVRSGVVGTIGNTTDATGWTVANHGLVTLFDWQ